MAEPIVALFSPTKPYNAGGTNSYGQLGNGSTVSSSTRVNVTGLSDATSITAGLYHTCANTTAGRPKCWGYNNNGQVGNGTFTNALLPTPVSGISSGVTAVAASSTGYSTCAVLTSGEAKCWGDNAQSQLGNGSGQLGIGVTTPIPFPVDVLGLAGSAPPNAPVPLSPITSNTPVYTWKALPGATFYRMNVNGVISTWTAAALGCDGGVGLCRVTGGYLTPGSYTWYVQGYNSYGDGVWSAGTTFTL